MSDQDAQRIKSAMDEAVLTTFTEMAFLDIVPLAESADIDHQQVMTIQLFEPIRGSIQLYMSKEGKQTVVENIHADGWEHLTMEEIDDCLLEILNVLAGNFLSEYRPSGPKPKMSFPEIVFDPSEIEQGALSRDFYYDGEGIPVRISFRLEQMEA